MGISESIKHKVLHGSRQLIMGSIWVPFLGLAKAFDCVNHDILLQILDCYGIRGGEFSYLCCSLYNMLMTYQIQSIQYVHR